jgi:hypothetical protein
MASKPGISIRITNNRGNVTLCATHSRPCLIQYNGDFLGQRFLLDAPEITIGRSSSNGIVILDDLESEFRRCRIYREPLSVI